MKNKQLSENIKTAFDHATPDVWDNILTACEERSAQPVVLPTRAVRKRMPHKAIRAAAAALVLIAGGAFGASFLANRVDSVIILDVNPSIQMEISRSEKVLQARALNAEGDKLLDGMDLRGANLDVAVNALIGSMVRQGFLDEYANSVLLTVENSDHTRGAELERRLSWEIGSLLKASRLDGAVLSQSLTGDPELADMAGEFGISEGKAALIQKILKSHPLMDVKNLAALSVNDLNLLISSKKVETSEVASTGSASDKSYIGKEQAKAIALNHAGISEADVKRMEIEMDCDDGIMVYEVEFEAGGIEYDYEVNATDGTLIGETPAGNGGVPASAQPWINAAKAREIALAHAGLPSNDIVVEAELENNVYEISFEHGGREYEYSINAVTGEIVRWESERED